MKNEMKKLRFPWKQQMTVSMKVPLLILFVLFGMVPMLICTKLVLKTLEQHQTESRMIEVQNQCQILSNKLTRVGYLRGEDTANALHDEIETVADIYNGRIVVVNRDYRIVQDTYHIAENRLHVAEEVLRCFQGEISSIYNKEKHYFIITIPIYDGKKARDIDGVMVTIISTEGIRLLAESVEGKMVLLVITISLFLFIAATMAVLIFLRPFRDLQAKLNQVADGALDTDINADTYRETRAISGAVERTLSKLKEVDQSRQEFVSNVSHELKTPITSIRVLADSLMGMGEVPVELYREFMEDISDEIDRESKIIDDLLALVKMDKSEAELTITRVNINELVEQMLKRLRPIANRQKVEVIFESVRDVTGDIDETKMSLAITNLVENAIKYNTENGWVRVTLDADHKFFYIKVADSGIGIPEEEQAYIFERFYRVDKARSRETGGSGLGLAITRNVVLMHKGAIKLSSKEGEGSVFTLRIPLNYIA